MSVKRLFDDFDSDSNSVIVDEDSGHCMSTHIFCGESTTVKKVSFLAPDSDAVYDEDVTTSRDVLNLFPTVPSLVLTLMWKITTMITRFSGKQFSVDEY